MSNILLVNIQCMTTDDSIKCWWAQSGLTGQVGAFQNPGFCLEALPSFLPYPHLALSRPFFVRSLALVPCSLLQNCTETLAMQATQTLDSTSHRISLYPVEKTTLVLKTLAHIPLAKVVLPL